MAKILFVGGGSVGHIAPGVAVLEQLQSMEPETSAHFVCSDRPDDAAFLRVQNLPFTVLRAPRVNLLFPLLFPGAVWDAYTLLRQQKPDVVFSKGGYVSVPVCIAAKLRGIPVILHESDAVSGYANRLISLIARTVCLGFPPAHPLPASHRFTGNPVRSMVTQGTLDHGLHTANLTGGKPVLLVMGGSQGATALNAALLRHLDTILAFCDVLHITGRGKAPAETAGRTGYYATEFATDTLPHFYACAAAALSRAGAGSIAELAANRIPAILVPLRGVGHDHQKVNAETAAHTGGCIYLEQDSLDTQLVPLLSELMTDRALRSQMAAKISALHMPDAASLIAKTIVECLADRGGRQ